MTTFLQTTPFLPRQWNFPDEDVSELANQMDIVYINLAQRVNERTIGIFPENFQAITGDIWYLNGTRYQTLRQVYQITSAAAINHGIVGIGTSQIYAFTKIYGTFTDGTNWYPLPYVDSTAANNQISLKVTPTQIVITAGAGTPPAITQGIIVLEWIAPVQIGE